MLLDLLINMLASKTPVSAGSRPASMPPAPEPLACGAIHRGTVAYVGPRFAKLNSEGQVVFVHLSEMAPYRIASASEVLQAGQVVHFVVLEPSARVSGEWQGSLTAVAEARKREALSCLHEGQKVSGTIVALRDNGVLLDADGIELFAPLKELSWLPIDHPAQAVSIGQVVQAEVRRITVPDWNPKWRQMRSSAIASLRTCQPRPTPVFIPMAFSALPFRLVAQVRRPPQLDAVVMHVLAELVAGRGVAEITTRTRLPALTLRAMARILEQEGMTRDGVPTARAHDLVDAETLARQINDSDLGGLVANAAQADVRYLDSRGRVPEPPYSSESHIPEYPHQWPLPAADKRADEQFLRLSGEAIPEAALELALDGPQRAQALALLGDSRLQLRLRANGARRPICTAVPDQWVHAALWAAFDAVGACKPYRPDTGTARASHLLLVHARGLGADGAPVGDVFYEPYSKTLWQQRDASAVRTRVQAGSVFPDLPDLPEGGMQLNGGKVASRLQALAWHAIHIRESRMGKPA